ncbi:hypothetical protein [Pallidibacillus pasinlerensis]|uniref:Phage protein n=1 Tax=Pallidibacillus pasinlerensis TaxID=2703818 RepID=A0ABX0A3X4_9BACI|nr:hypothetical protein [Pallidibacillus pasinlerensis]NCU17229.1 hypothetical protein [Pallidibacillus pasinlerensis]
MTKNDQPKYSIGDQIVIVENGIFSEIVKIYQLGGDWYYQLKDRKDLYYEKNLMLKSDYDRLYNRKENVQINYKYRFGDIVRVWGYGQDLFVIIGFRAEIWRYKDSAWEDVIYELARVSDGAWLEATEEELTYITNEENAKRIIDSKKSSIKKAPLLNPPTKQKKVNKDVVDVDMLLDMYNDFQYLYLNFGDSTYRRKMREIIKKLEALSNNPFQKKD